MRSTQKGEFLEPSLESALAGNILVVARARRACSARRPIEQGLGGLSATGTAWAAQIAPETRYPTSSSAGSAAELNPQEQPWDELDEKELPHRVFADLANVVRQPNEALPYLAAEHARIKSICA